MRVGGCATLAGQQGARLRRRDGVVPKGGGVPVQMLQVQTVQQTADGIGYGLNECSCRTGLRRVGRGDDKEEDEDEDEAEKMLPVVEENVRSE